MPIIERSAGFIIHRHARNGDIEFLVLNYGRHWDFVKGHVEKGEDDLTAALRELREETGITSVRVHPEFRHQITYYFRDRKKGLVRKTVVFFLGQMDAANGAIVLSDEHEGFEFLPFAAAVKRVTFANARQVLRLANEQLSAPLGNDTMSSAPAKS